MMDLLLPQPDGVEARLYEAMRHSAFAGGKRLRPFLVMQSARQFGVDRRCAARVAAAVEFMHTYSLIHDDLPAMDDADMRRGRPSRSEERRVGKACVSTCRSRWSPYHYTQKHPAHTLYHQPHNITTHQSL